MDLYKIQKKGAERIEALDARIYPRIQFRSLEGRMEPWLERGYMQPRARSSKYQERASDGRL